MVDVHIIGEIVGCRGFGKPNLLCSWEIVCGNEWVLIEGVTKGQTHVIEDENTTVWAHPIDIHFTTRTMQGWPRLVTQVWTQDQYGRRDFCGYGCSFLSMNPSTGVHTDKLEVPCWQPRPLSILAQLRAALIGGHPVLKDETVVHHPDDRHKLHTISTGVISANVHTIVRGFEALGIAVN